IGPTIAANNAGATISYVDALSVANGVITLTTTGTTTAGAKMALTLTPTVTAGGAALDWTLTGTGCTTAGRAIKCSKN
ncbi:MAG TPA: hypothetical protein PKL58_00970, partial [Methylophilaceae bacterium]|nr:hypothetical protein [Methylophilaceae bacterium]